MSKDNFIRGVGEVDDKILDRYEKVEEKISQRNKKNKYFIRWATVAACIALILGAIPMAVWISKRGVDDSPVLKVELQEVPDYENALYSAEEIAGMFESTFDANDYDTHVYRKVYVPNPAYLYCKNIPDFEYLPIYNRKNIKTELDRDEFEDFISGFMPNLSEALEMPEYTVSGIEERQEENCLTVSINTGKNIIDFRQDGVYQGVCISYLNTDSEQSVTLEGETIIIDQRKDDDEIIESLSGIKSKLFDIFGVSFSDVKVIRQYDSYNKYGVEFLSVYYYNDTDCLLDKNKFSPISDYIEVRFDNSLNYKDLICSDSLLSRVRVIYSQNRFDIDQRYQVEEEARIISLEEAESLLYNGYVFGGLPCRFCMQEQEKVNFEGYDFVDLDYYFGSFNENGDWGETKGIPFYVFYKYIGISENGNLIYASTLVPAIEVSGLKEYFEMQKVKYQ